jgi:formylglycine-generating enzyme required for sulfatase activity
MKAMGNVFCLLAVLLMLGSLAGCQKTQHSLTITVSGNGTTSPAAGTHKYDEGQSVPITATPAANWHFDHWEGSLSGNSNPATIDMGADESVEAVFTAGSQNEGEAEGEAEGEGEGEGLPAGRIAVPEGTYVMGGIHAESPQSDQLPRHNVHLTAYEIMKFDVTNGQYAAMLNWALAHGRLRTDQGQAYDGGNVYSANQFLFSLDTATYQIDYNDTTKIFFVISRDSLSMDSHPVVNVSWYGAALFCNWLSESLGLTPCYNTLTWACNFNADGFHLPTEAQWERAAAWDAQNSRHWIYGFSSDTIDATRANYEKLDGGIYLNPLGLSDYPYTTPVGWFNGINVSPNGGVQTVDSRSPAGCYDMSGTVWQWCNDWYKSDYYSDCLSLGTVTNPAGPAAPPDANNPERVVRGGSWYDYETDIHTAGRAAGTLDSDWDTTGFRMARY